MAKEAGNNAVALQQIPIEGFLWVKNLWQPDTFLKSATIIPTFDQIKQYKALVSLTDFDEVMKPLQDLYVGYTNGWFVLPLAAGGMSFLQSHITMPQTQPTTGDVKNPMSGKMMKYFLPAFSVFICITASAAFALYWTVSNIISVASHVVIDKILNAKEAETNA
jgi:membrane protein insertase Oxa1/YidC/SpoIIIJ